MAATLTVTDLDNDRCPRCGDKLSEPRQLVELTVHHAVMAERERCAKIAEGMTGRVRSPIAKEIAQAIRNQ
jgi:hypothetical protein